MSDASPASPEPLRRRRSRDRAAGTGEDDSWAHLVGLGRPWDTGTDQPEVPMPLPPADAENGGTAPPSRRDRVRDQATDEPLSRRAARRREAESELPADDVEPAVPDPGLHGDSGMSTGGMPLRPWWAASRGPATDGFPAPTPLVPPAAPAVPAEPAADVPAAFLRQESPAPPVAPEPSPPPEALLSEPQVNPWPGQVRPALPSTGAGTGVRQGPAQRTSDVTGSWTRSDPTPEPAPLEVALPADVAFPAEVVLPVDRVPAAGPPTGPLAGTSPGAWTGPLSLSHGHAGEDRPVFAGPVLPAPELPGPVLPGVEAVPAAPSQPVSAAEVAAESAPPAAPMTRRRARAAAAPASPATADSGAAGTAGSATGTLYVPTTGAAGAAPETDVRIVPVAAGAPGGSARTLQRRRLAAAPARFPSLGPSGDVVEADPVDSGSRREATGRRPAPLFPEPSSQELHETSTITTSRRGRRPAPAGATPATGVPALPVVSGPATGEFGSGGLPLPGLAPGLPAAAAGTASALGAAAGGLLGGHATAPVAGAAAAGAAGAGTLDVIAGLGRAGRAARRPDPARSRGRSMPRTPLRAVDDADDDRPTRTIAPVPVREPAAAGREETPSPRRSARSADSSLGPTVPDDPATGADGPADETALTRPVRPTTEPTGGASGDGPDATPRFSPRRAARTGQTGETPPVALAAVPAVSPGRAGRNLPAAVGVGVALAGLVLASLLVRKEAFVLVITAAILVALWELTGALRTKRIEVPVVPLGVGALGMLVSAFVAGEDGLLVSFALTAFGVLLWRIIDGHDGATRDVAASVFVAAYVPFLAGFAMLMLAMPDGALRVLTFIAVTVSNDIGGYATGVLAGRHPMAPTISPKKSWEGMAGSLVLCMVVGAATVHYLLDGSILAGLAVGAAAAITATIGDLSESLIKRDLGIKDMGNLLPGHGGIMDRLDSLLPTAPAAYLLLLLLVPVVR